MSKQENDVAPGNSNTYARAQNMLVYVALALHAHIMRHGKL